MPPKELARRLAASVRRTRTAYQLSQAEFARACNISVRTYKRFETTGQASLENFLRVVTVMERVQSLSLLVAPAPTDGLSPLERQRKRLQLRTTIRALAEGQRHRSQDG